MSTLLVVDVGNLRNNIMKKFGEDKKLNYEKFTDQTKGIDDLNIVNYTAYGVFIEDNVVNFQTMLRSLGYQTKFKRIKKGNWYIWDTGIAVDVMDAIANGRITDVIIGSSSIGLIPLIYKLKEKGINVTIYACGISDEVKKAVNGSIEITEDLLLD